MAQFKFSWDWGVLLRLRFLWNSGIYIHGCIDPKFGLWSYCILKGVRIQSNIRTDPSGKWFDTVTVYPGQALPNYSLFGGVLLNPVRWVHCIRSVDHSDTTL